MMGRSHALTGAAGGILIAPAIGITDTAEITILAGTTAGYALLPDLDHPGSTASKLLGPITWAAGGLLRLLSKLTHATTKTDEDSNSGTHRHLSHTAVFAAVLGVIIGITASTNPYVALATVVLGILLAAAATSIFVAPIGLAALATWHGTVTDPIAVLDDVGPLLGIAVGVGCLIHTLGDALTKSAVPLLWPLPIGGDPWRCVGPPKFLRFTTGSFVENWLVVPAICLVAALSIPEVADAAHDLINTAE